MTILLENEGKTSNSELITPPPVFQDRKPLLVVFGILQLFLAAIIVALIFLAVINMIMKKDDIGSFMDPMRLIMPALFFYGMLIIWFIWLGIGSIKTKRWAWALTLVSSWLWLIGGFIGTVMLLLLMRDWFDVSPHAADRYKLAVRIMGIMMVVLGLVFFIFIPGMFILVYSRRNIRLTCEFYDRQIRWTDQCPLPVLALVLLLVFAIIFLLGALGFIKAVPFYGALIMGWPAIIILLILSVVFGYSAWGLYRVAIKAWWITLMAVIIMSVSTSIAFYRFRFKSIFLAMVFPEDFISIFSVPQNNLSESLFGIWGVPVVGYLLFIRKYFVGKKQEGL